MTIEEFRTTLVLLSFEVFSLEGYLDSAAYDSCYKHSMSNLELFIVHKNPHIIRIYTTGKRGRILSSNDFSYVIDYITGYIEAVTHDSSRV